MPTPCLPPEGQRRRSGAFAWLGIKTCGAACLVAAAAAVMTGCGTPDRPGPASAPHIDTRAVPMRDAGSPLPEGWQHGAFMEIFVRSYADSDGDGIGDLRGLTSRLDHLQRLGVRGIWLMPITANADGDHGYATTDFRRIAPEYGTLADFDELIRQAHARGIGVIMDYVINHAAAEHPMFVQARQGPRAPWRDWFVWSDAAPTGWDIWGKNPWYHTPSKPWQLDVEPKNLPVPPPGSRDFYFGTFGQQMPDFNFRNPAVVAYHHDSLRFWLNRGLDGFRLDAVPHLIENNAKDWNDQPESRALTRQIQALTKAYARRYTVCEATAQPRDYAQADLCGAAFAFGLESQLAKAAGGDADAIRQVAAYPASAPPTMGVFVSNHDIFAGRRLWDQVGGDLARYKLTAATYLLLPGTPYIYYGEEIGQSGAEGLQDDPQIRGPMSWTADAATAGFSTGKPYRALATNRATHNAAAQAAQADGLFAHYQALIALRNALPSIARGSYEQAVASGATLSFQRRLGAEHTLLTYNYGTAPATLAVAGLPAGARLVAALPASLAPQAADAAGQAQVRLPAQSFAVWRVVLPAQPPEVPALTTAPLSPQGAACSAAPLGDTPLYLRGTMNEWQADEASEFVWRCSAYQLNVQLSGEHRFKLADGSWRDDTILANARGVATEGLPPVLARGPATAELRHTFAGAQTLTLRFGPTGPQLNLTSGHFDDVRLRPVTHPTALSLRHDSRALVDKQPFGAVPAGTEVVFALSALPGVEQATLVIERRQLEGNQTVLAYHPLARVPLQRSTAGAQAGQERFAARHRFDAIGVHGYWFEVRIAGETYVLHNNLDTIPWTREKGSNGLAMVGRAPDAQRNIRRLRLSVYQSGFTVPAWAADAVYYYVFPERFRNGDPANDPQPGQRRYQNHAIERHARWNEAPFKPGSGDGSDKVFNNDFFGGDLAGIIDKLDYIRALGANAIYLTPVFTAPSNHKYDTADFRQIDPAFGTNADFTRLTQEAAMRGMRVIPDASLNHVGSDSVYFDRYGNHATGPDGRPNIGAFANARIRADSPWAGWFTFDATQTAPERQYRGWAGEEDLPEVDKNAPGWRDFAYRAPDSVTRTWLQRGAAGWRMDVAPYVPDDFWREWRAVVKQTDPNALTIAETWHDASRHLLGDMFDSTMNYIFRNVVLDYAAGGSASAAVKPLELLREQYPPQALHALMNLLSSHDQPRALHQLGDTRLPGPAVDAATIDRARQRLKLAVLLQMSYPGAPAVYYGDEVGLTGGADPYNRAPYPWADQGGQPDEALRADFTRMIALRHAHPVLRRGILLAPLHADDAVLVLARRLVEGAGGVGFAGGAGRAGAADGTAVTWALTAFNNADTPRTVTVAMPEGAPDGPYAAAWGDAPAEVRGGRVTLTMPAMSGRVLVKAP